MQCQKKYVTYNHENGRPRGETAESSAEGLPGELWAVMPLNNGTSKVKYQSVRVLSHLLGDRFDRTHAV